MLIDHVLLLQTSHTHDLAMFTRLVIGKAHSGSLPCSVSCPYPLGPNLVLSLYTAFSCARKPAAAAKCSPALYFCKSTTSPLNSPATLPLPRLNLLKTLIINMTKENILTIAAAFLAMSLSRNSTETIHSVSHLSSSSRNNQQEGFRMHLIFNICVHFKIFF